LLPRFPIPSSGEPAAKLHFSTALDAESPVPIQFDFFCGVCGYVAPERGGQLLKAT